MITPEIKKTLIIELEQHIKEVAEIQDQLFGTYDYDSEYGIIYAKAHVTIEEESEGDGIDTERTHSVELIVDIIKAEIYDENDDLITLIG